MDDRTLLSYEDELMRIMRTIPDKTFTSRDVDIHGNILRKMWHSGILVRSGKQKGLKGLYVYKLPKDIRTQFEVIISGETY